MPAMTDAAARNSTGNLASDEARLAALNAYDALDAPTEAAFDRIARLVKLYLGVQTAIVSLMDSHRQWYLAAEGADVREVPLDQTFCREFLCGASSLVVGDAS